MSKMEEQPAIDPKQNLERQARKQVPGPVTSSKAGDASGAVNIWSGRRMGPRADGGSSKSEKQRKPSQHRCNPALDTGRTRGSEGQINQFCLFFAKGMCYQGSACTYLHRLPTSADNQAMARNTSQDIFGREKMPDRLDNRKGAGSYDRDMTTLYVNYGGAGHYATPQLRHLLLQNFGEFGPIRSIYIVPAKTIAFVKYHWRVSAEFAKEAMDSQSLTGSTLNEVLSVRWSNDDPNPVAIIGRKREALDAAESAALAAWENMPAEEKQARLAMMHQAKARKVSAVADKLPEVLLHGADGVLQNSNSSREQFDEWRGVTGQQSEAVHDGSTAVQHEQQQQEEEDGHYAQWSEYYAAHPEAYAQWQQYYASQQQQQHGAAAAAAAQGQAGAWYEGWRQRPHSMQAATTSSTPPAAAAAAHTAEINVAAAGGGGGSGGLGLLAGYGSGSDSGDDSDENGSNKQQQQQQEQQPDHAQQQQQQPLHADVPGHQLQSSGEPPETEEQEQTDAASGQCKSQGSS